MEKSPEKEKKINLFLEDLNALESYISDVFTFSPLPLCFVSRTGVILESNPAFEKISNLNFDEIVGKTIDQLFEKKEIKKLIRSTLKRGLVEGREMKFFPKAKKKVLVQVFTKTKKDEKRETVGYFLSLFDLTRIKKTERELRKRVEELERFHTLTVGRELKMIELKKKIKELSTPKKA